VMGLTGLAFLLGQPTALIGLSPKNIVILVISAVTAIAIAHVLFYAAIHRIGATIPSMINLLTPFCVLLLSRVVFGEHLTGGQWFFGLLLISGIALAGVVAGVTPGGPGLFVGLYLYGFARFCGTGANDPAPLDWLELW
ncbi:DMT family transporter, partial [Trichothermofontia sp.]